jgi:hypothetical protein
MPELAAHDMFTHRDGRVCILVEDGTWFVPLDAGGEGYTCEREHDPLATDERNDMSDENENEQPTSIYLSRAKMLPIEGVVYCLEHTAVHDDTTDPYGYGEPDCSVKEHRAVLYRARKGDIDETLANGDDPPDRTVIAAAQKDQLSDDERTLLRGLVERERSKAGSALAEMREVFGIDDLGQADRVLALLDSTYQKIGGAE